VNGYVQTVLVIGGSFIAAGVVAAFSGLPAGWQVVLFIGLLIVLTGVMLAVGRWWNQRSPQRRVEAPRPAGIVAKGGSDNRIEHNVIQGYETGISMEDEKRSTAQGNVTSYNQSGGITAGTVNVSAPQPAVHGQVEFTSQPHEGKYHTRARIQLDAPYAAGGLQVVVEGSSISDLSVTPDQTAAMFGVTTYDNKPSSAGVEMQPPLAPRYIADVITDQPDTLNIRLAIR
jgi:parallel beta-helix repeat protein